MKNEISELGQRIEAVEQILHKLDPLQTEFNVMELKSAVEGQAVEIKALEKRLSAMEKMTHKAVSLMEDVAVKQLALEKYIRPEGTVH